MRKAKGFTLIELIIVIVILGILAVVAAPRFVEYSTDAKIASLESMKASLKAGAEFAYAKAVIEGKTSGLQSIEDNGDTISLNEGYPRAVFRTGVRYIVNLDDSDFVNSNVVCEEDWCGLGNQSSLPSGVSIASGGRVTKLFLRGYTYQDECGVYYINNADGNSPIIGLETNEC